MSHRERSQYRDHPRITWFGVGGTVAYVDYTGPTTSYFVGVDDSGGFKVVPPGWAADVRELTGFGSIDDGISYALAQAIR